jgi:hypothetical protein
VEPHAPRRKKPKRNPRTKTAPALVEKLQVSREEAAAMLSISIRSVDYLIATKLLSTRRIGARVVIPIEDVRRFARADHPKRLAS